MSGALVIDKPSGPSSHDVVARARRALGTRRVGHTGTLDPLATGVLPLVVGAATRLARYLTASDKSYAATVRLGAATDTYDAMGRILPRDASRPPDSVTMGEIARALEAFRGPFLQTPPPFSAKKISGVRSYSLARRGDPSAAPAPVAVTVHELELAARDGSRLDLRIVASAGFYVRSLAHDLGMRLGCGAHLEALRRTRSGEFDEGMAIPLSALDSATFRPDEQVIPASRLLARLPAVVLNGRGLERAAHGAPLGPADVQNPETLAPGVCRGTVRLIAIDGTLVGIAASGPEPAPEGEGDKCVLHPVTVLV